MSLLRKFHYQNRRENAINPFLESVISNLNHILNSKRDYSYFLKDFGVRDLNYYSSRAAIAEAVVSEVCQSINRYEPRVELNGVTLVNDKNPMHLSFKIDCKVKSQSEYLRLVFDTVFNTCKIIQPDEDS
jgi:type VI secretion system lysozyme-like protein